MDVSQKTLLYSQQTIYFKLNETLLIIYTLERFESTIFTNFFQVGISRDIDGLELKRRGKKKMSLLSYSNAVVSNFTFSK